MPTTPPPPSHPTSLAAAATVNSVISSSHYVLVYTVQYVWVCSVQPLIQTLSAVSTFLIYVLMYKTVKLLKLCFQQFLILVFISHSFVEYTVTVCKIFTKFKLFCCAFFCFHTLTVNYTFNPLPLLSPFWLFYSHFDYYLWLSSYLPSNSLMPLLPLLCPFCPSYPPPDSYPP